MSNKTHRLDAFWELINCLKRLVLGIEQSKRLESQLAIWNNKVVAHNFKRKSDKTGEKRRPSVESYYLILEIPF